MALKLESNNLVYDELDPRCRLHIIGGVVYLEVMDMGADHCMAEDPHIKRYRGPWNWEKPEASVRGALLYGGKWEKLPTKTGK